VSNGLRRRDMRPYQRWGVDQIYDNETTILAWDMGAGKSVTALTAFDDLFEDKVIKKLLIVAPMLVARATYPDEFEDWKHLSHMDWTLLRVEDEDDRLIKFRKEALVFARNVIGLSSAEATSWANKQKTKKKEWLRKKLADDRAEIHIINRESFAWLWHHFDDGKRWPYDAIMWDEASAFKNGTKRTAKKELSQFGAMAKARKFCKRIVLMTGTPSPKGLMNLWGLAYIADLGDRLGTSKIKFRDRWFDSDYMGWNYSPKAGAQEAITDRLSDIMFALDPSDYPDMPPLINRTFHVDLSRRTMERYEEFKRTLVSEAYDVEAVNKGVLAGKLLQFANGSMYNEDRQPVWIHDEKLFALEELIEEADGENVMVAYSFRFDLDRITKRFPKAVIFGNGDVRKTKADWNAGKIPLMLVHPQSVGHGQNIQFGGHINIWYGLTPDLETYQQLNKRLHRPGQTRPVSNHHIIARGTFDDDMLPRLKDRDATQQSIMRALQLDMIAFGDRYA